MRRHKRFEEIGAAARIGMYRTKATIRKRHQRIRRTSRGRRNPRDFGQANSGFSLALRSERREPYSRLGQTSYTRKMGKGEARKSGYFRDFYGVPHLPTDIRLPRSGLSIISVYRGTTVYECESPSSDPVQPQNGLKELVWDFYFSFRQQVFTSCTFLIFVREPATSKYLHIRDYAVHCLC